MKEDILNKEIAELQDDKNRINDEKFASEQIIDKNKEEIVRLEKELQKAVDEAELRRVIFDTMSANLLKHEEDS